MFGYWWKGLMYLNVMFGSLMSNLCFSQGLVFSHSHGVDPLNFNMATICTSFHRFLKIL